MARNNIIKFEKTLPHRKKWLLRLWKMSVPLHLISGFTWMIEMYLDTFM